MPRNVQISLLLMGAVAVISLLYVFNVADRIQTTPQIETDETFREPEAPLYKPTDPPLGVKLFFPGTNNDILLRTRDMTIFASAEIENQARQILEHLIQGTSDDNLFGRLPLDTRLNQAFVGANGVIYLDFNSALSDNHPGGVLPELATIYAIVNSLTYNLEEIARVKILIGGVEKETLAGHCLLLLPLVLDLSITDIAPIEQLTPASLPATFDEILNEN